MSATLASGLDPARAVDPARYAMRGDAPRAALRPATREELSEALRWASREALGVVPWGGGTWLAQTPAPARYDVALDLGALDRIVEYEPEDLTVTAECGVTIATLRATLAARGQELPLEGADAIRATLGGLLAANASGARRRQLGAPRDRILGARFALGDGTLARTGGKVVKNVAGYAMHRLACGSRGGLAIFVEASFKLLPAPAARIALIYDATREQLLDNARWAAFPRLEPAALTVVCGERASRLPGGSGEIKVVVGFEEDAARVAEQTALTIGKLGEPALRLESTSATELWQALADHESSGEQHLTFATAANTSTALAPLFEFSARAQCVFHVPAGRLHVFTAAVEPRGLISALAPRGFALIDSSPDVELHQEVFHFVAISDLRERLRSQLDPGRRFSLGERRVLGS